MKTIMGIYHGRIQYPSMATIVPESSPAEPPVTARIA
jgi:hypothetical protein